LRPVTKTKTTENPRDRNTQPPYTAIPKEPRAKAGFVIIEGFVPAVGPAPVCQLAVMLACRQAVFLPSRQAGCFPAGRQAIFLADWLAGSRAALLGRLLIG